MGCPVSSFMTKLKFFAGLPVPYVVKYVDGKPDFRQSNLRRWAECAKKKICPVCGTKLGSYAFYVGGPKSMQNMMFSDTGMHLPCAKTSMGLCPFLKGDRDHYRGELPDNGLVDTSHGRPDAMFLAKGLTAAAQLKEVHGQPIMYSGKLEILEQF